MTALSPMQAIKSAMAFGKYNDKTVEDALCEYAPRHNAMQARFLDADFRMKVVALSYFPYLLEKRWYTKKPLVNKVDFEVCDWDVVIDVDHETVWREGDEIVLSSDYISASLFVDVIPDIGDDYPLVLRWMKEQSARVGVDNKQLFAVLVYDKFIGKGITEQEMSDIFQACGFAILSLAEIDATDVIDIESHVARSVGFLGQDRGKTEDKLFRLDIPCRNGGTAHLKATSAHHPLEVTFDDDECAGHCAMCHELTTYTLLCVGTCPKE